MENMLRTIITVDLSCEKSNELLPTLNLKFIIDFIVYEIIITTPYIDNTTIVKNYKR